MPGGESVKQLVEPKSYQPFNLLCPQPGLFGHMEGQFSALEED